ncbi:MAG: hypothetical protein H0U89_04400 [Acidimicrobiia bacterium]|nr:hypothetical protein [Acidimicrobiia bacterium]
MAIDAPDPPAPARARTVRRIALALLVVAIVPFALFLGPCRDDDDPTAPEADAATDFERRKARFVDSLLALDAEGEWWDLEARKGLVLLDRARTTGDESQVEEANERLRAGADRVDEGLSDARVIHGGAFTFLRAVLDFRDEPDLLHDDTEEVLRAALATYRDEVFGEQADDEPWEPAIGTGETENHQLQVIVTGMLLSEVEAGQRFEGRPVKDDDPTTDDLWSWFREAYLRYNSAWGDGRTDHFNWDVSASEKDSLGYFHVYLGDHWLVRDLHSDPVIREQAEILVDRFLADWAEDAVGGLYTGYSGRHYHRSHVDGSSTWALNYLLFDGLGRQPATTGEDAIAADTGWGGWAHLSIVTGGYTPDTPAFPQVLVDLARDKGDGYLVREGRVPQANWVEADLALGFLASGRGSYDFHTGGFYAAGEGPPEDGLNVAPYYGDEPFPAGQGKPSFLTSSVVSRRVAITRTWDAVERRPGRDQRRGTGDDVEERVPRGRLFVSDVGAVVERSGPWLLVAQPAPDGGRAVYLGVRPAAGSFRELDEVQGGRAFELTAPGVASIWEVSTSGEHAGLQAFARDLRDNPLGRTGDQLTYSSSALGTTLGYETDDDGHEIDGRQVDLAAFEHGFSTPWSSSPHGTGTARVERDGRSVVWDWDPDDDGNYDERPTKVVDNDASPVTARP